ncbi:unnamed protein product [Staurois parvus]|uniref:Uncharacterized protein n=1 Tax=Staurois parvus TaxID=386267 RepID=A0ABN9D1Q5_9NEOB|nr:unnamed protein product [Staurois parvus]
MSPSSVFPGFHTGSHTIPHHHQSGILGDDNIDVKEEYKEEDEEYGVMEEFSEGHKDMMMDPVMGTHQRDVPVLCIPGIPHRKVTPSLTIIRVESGDENIDVKEEYKEEDEEYGVMEEFSEGHKDMMEPLIPGTHQRDVPVLCIPGIPHKKVTPSLTVTRVEIQSI